MSQPKQTSPAVAPGHSDILNDWALRAEETEETPKPGGWRKVALPAAIAGIIFVVLYLISFYLLARTPLGNATDAEIIAYYGDGTNLTLTLAGMLIMPFVGIAFLYFMVLLRATSRATGLRASRVLGNAQLATGTIFIALLFVATAGLHRFLRLLRAQRPVVKNVRVARRYGRVCLFGLTHRSLLFSRIVSFI